MGLSVEKQIVERRGRRQPRRRHDMAKCIRETLLALGGEAHRTQVIEQLAREFGVDVRHIPDDLRISVIRAFEDIVCDEAKRTDFGFHLPFGPGSHRWGVKFIAEPAN
jgi:hypothetical protein